MGKGLIGILHNRPLSHESGFSEASRDVLIQVGAIADSLGLLGYRSVSMPFSGDICELAQVIREHDIRMVFNLCETVDEDARLSGHPAAVLELLKITYSGSPSFGLMLSTDKWMTKQFLRSNGILTPECVLYNGQGPFDTSELKYPVIVKPRFEDASIGIDQESIFKEERDLKRSIGSFFERFGDVLIEEYVDGRELNVSLLGYPDACVLPVAEIVFRNFHEGLYPIVGYRAKWKSESYEFQNTPRIFPQDIDPDLRANVQRVSLQCFNSFMLRDYGRVDLRVNGKGDVFVLEINANPCLSPDAGFASAVEKGGISYMQMVEKLVSFMVARNEKRQN
jgi:D-alanine-D-alanine ligase